MRYNVQQKIIFPATFIVEADTEEEADKIMQEICGAMRVGKFSKELVKRYPQIIWSFFHQGDPA